MMDIIQIFGDYAKLMGMVMLLLKILTSKDCAGISLRTQMLYCMVSITRYLDLFESPLYLMVMKIIFISLPVITVLLMLIYKEKYDAKYDKFRVIHLIVPCALIAIVLKSDQIPTEQAWVFSEILESVAMLPQIYLVTKKNQVESIIIAYICSLGLFRGFYLFHWGYQKMYNIRPLDRFSLTCALIQLFFYVDFFAKNLPTFKSKYADKYNGAASTLLEGATKNFNQSQIIIPNVCSVVERKDTMADTEKIAKSKGANALESVVFTTPVTRDEKDNLLKTETQGNKIDDEHLGSTSS